MIGKVITAILTSRQDLISLVPASKIFPYIITEETALPVIVYTINSLDPVYVKDGWAQDVYTFSIMSFHHNYSTLQDIAYEIREAFELKRPTHPEVIIQRIVLTGQAEGFNFDENVYTNKLDFKITINGK